MNEPVPETKDPWTLYWQADHLDSCIASASKSDAGAIAAFWQSFARRIDDTASVLDLATGNGTVPRCLLQANATLEITAVDKADIDPMAWLQDGGDLGRVEFVGNVDICALPFAPERFDAVTSQFGLEYAPLGAAARSAAEVLKHGGVMQLLLHHADSEIVKPATARRDEIGRLLAAGGIIHALVAYINNQIPLKQLEATGQDHMDSGHHKTAAISGQIFDGVNRVILGLQEDRREAELLATSMVTRLTAEHARLGQLLDAALTEQQVTDIRENLQNSGIDVERLIPLMIGETPDSQALIGWQLSGKKR